MKKTFRNKLLLWFLLFSFATLVIFIPYNAYYFGQKQQLLGVTDNLNKVYMEILKDEIIQQSFLSLETINPVYFGTGESNYLSEHIATSRKIDSLLHDLSLLKKVIQLGFIPHINIIQKQIENSNKTFLSLENLILERGFENYGIVGEMRHNIHLVENSRMVSEADVLSIRRREKDYIIRNQQVYIDLLNSETHKLKVEILAGIRYSRNNKDSLFQWLDNYQRLFNTMVAFDRQTGMKDNTGLYHKLYLQREDIINNLQNLIQHVQQKQTRALLYYRYQYILVVVFLIFLSVVASLVFSKKITEPVSMLSGSITRFVKSSFTFKEDLVVINPDDQIGKLTHNFIVMRNKIIEHINFFKQKVEERTNEIRNQKDEILAQKEEIEVQNTRLEIQKQQLEDHNRKMHLKNKHILDSITYAKNIQNTILPDEAFIHRIFPNHFIYFTPKDIVSGDFYWFDKVQEEGQHYALFAAIDCTGHGVPGALMSLLAHNGLQRVVNANKLTHPGKILQSLNANVFQSLNHYKNESRIFDSLDIACCRLNLETHELLFCGAFRPALVVRNGKLEIFHGNRTSVGNSHSDLSNMYTHIIQLQKDDMIYLFSDGYADQFGGNENKKFKNKRFYALLEKISNKDLMLQHRIIYQTILEWQQDNEQVDDQLIIGIRV